MTYVYEAIVLAISAMMLAVVGLPDASSEARCNGAEKGSIVEVVNCPQMPEKVKVPAIP